MNRDLLTIIAYSAIVVQGLFALAFLFAGIKFSEWTKETRKERRAADRQARSNYNLVDFVTRHSGIDPRMIDPAVLDRDFDDGFPAPEKEDVA